MPSRLAGLLIVACLVLLGGAARAQPSPSCPGDCNLDGAVSIDELLRGVNFLIDGLPASDCEELDDNRNGVVSVNELVRAVLKALLGCRLTGAAAAAAAAHAALGVADSGIVIDIGSAAAGGGGSAAVPGRRSLDPPGARGAVPPCSGGGTLDESCVTEPGLSRLTSRYTACRTVISDRLALIVDGERIRVVPDEMYCATRVEPVGVEITETLREFHQELVASGEVTVAELAQTLERRRTIVMPGCDGIGGSERLNGDLSYRCQADPPAVACPPQGRDLQLVARELTVLRTSFLSGDACNHVSTWSGRLETSDRVSGQQFDAVYREFVMRQALLDDGGTLLALDGALGVDCLGELAMHTEIPLLQPIAARCPNNGLVYIELSDGPTVGASYIEGGLSIDLDGDGAPDVASETCEDASLAQCS